MLKESERQRAEKRGRLTIVGSYLDDLRADLGFTWDTLGAAAKVDPSTVSRILQGDTKEPRIDTLQRICAALKISDPDVLDDVLLSYGHSTEDIQQHAVQRLEQRLKQKRSSQET